MNNLPEIDLSEKVSLDTAWFHYADLALQTSNNRERYYSLRFPRTTESSAEIDRREAQLLKFTRGLRIDFTAFIREGYFIAFGCYLGEGKPSSEHIQINKAFFDPNAEGFKIDYDENRVCAYGKSYVDVEVLPNADQLRAHYPTKFPDLDKSNDGKPITVVPGPKVKMGRPASEGIEKAIVALKATDPDFAGKYRGPQCDQVREYLFPEGVDHLNPPNGYRDGAIKSRLRKLVPVTKS